MRRDYCGICSSSAARGAVTGTLRINAMNASFAMGLTRLIARLAWEHPRLVIEVHTNEAFVDIVAQGRLTIYARRGSRRRWREWGSAI